MSLIALSTYLLTYATKQDLTYCSMYTSLMRILDCLLTVEVYWAFYQYIALVVIFQKRHAFLTPFLPPDILSAIFQTVIQPSLLQCRPNFILLFISKSGSGNTDQAEIRLFTKLYQDLQQWQTTCKSKSFAKGTKHVSGKKC